MIFCHIIFSGLTLVWYVCSSFSCIIEQYCVLDVCFPISNIMMSLFGLTQSPLFTLDTKIWFINCHIDLEVIRGRLFTHVMRWSSLVILRAYSWNANSSHLNVSDLIYIPLYVPDVICILHSKHLLCTDGRPACINTNPQTCAAFSFSICQCGTLSVSM